MAGYDKVAPNASAMIESMRAYGYTLPAAIADLVDNSIAAGCSTVWLRLHWAGRDSWITVTDDGAGMSDRELREAMRFGSRSPLESRDRTDLGRFGLGLKTASLSHCRRLTVVSRSRDGRAAAVRRWDLDYLAKHPGAGWRLLKSSHRESGDRARLASHLKTGTVVLWERLDRLVEDVSVSDRRRQEHFLQMIEQVEEHLGMIFHRYLCGRRPRLRIHINDNPDSIKPWDPFLQDHEATEPTPVDRLAIPDHDDPVTVQGFVLPHRDKLGEREHRSAAGPAGWNAQQGFYLYRNERLIVPGSWLGLGGGRPWTREEHYKLARIQLHVPSSMDHLWHLDVKKSSARPPPQIRDRLTGLAQKIRSNARSVFAHRGKYRQRTSKEELPRPWKVFRQKRVIRYRIDREHPLVEAVVSACADELKAELEAMFRIIEETVPVEQIWLDTAEKPEEIGGPFEGCATRELRQLVTIAYGAIRRNRGFDHETAVNALLERDEFSSSEARAVIATFREMD